jgi:hypothetical protein
LELNLGDREIEKLKKNIRHSALSFVPAAFVNELIVYVYEKKRLIARPVEHSLASFSIFVLGQSAPVMDQLVADERAVLAGGTVSIKRVLVNGKAGDFRVARIFLCTESEDRYYLVEIGFSPQTKKAARIWADLEGMLASFAILD